MNPDQEKKGVCRFLFGVLRFGKASVRAGPDYQISAQQPHHPEVFFSFSSFRTPADLLSFRFMTRSRSRPRQHEHQFVGRSREEKKRGGITQGCSAPTIRGRAVVEKKEDIASTREKQTNNNNKFRAQTEKKKQVGPAETCPLDVGTAVDD
ncbi:MAG: hypothetical protein WC763_06195 [Candidatus Paceibacterota bacterium]